MAIMIPRGGEFIDRILINAGEWRCEEVGCQFVRSYGTKAGAIEGASKHTLQKHHKQLRLPESFNTEGGR